MSKPAKATTTETTEIVWMFTEEEIEEIRKHDEAQTSCRLIKDSDDEAWYLSFNSRAGSTEVPYAFLLAHPQTQDLRLATSTKSWVREELTTWTLHLVLPEPKPGVDTKRMQVSEQYASSTPGWGSSLRLSVKELLSFYDEKKSLGLRFTITSSHRTISPSLSSKTRLIFFDDCDYADTVFVVHQPKQDPSHIFACKKLLVSASTYFNDLFNSGFAETDSQKKQDLGSFAITSDKESLSLGAAKEDLVPFSPSADHDVRESKRQRVSSAASKKGKQKQDDGAEDQVGTSSGRKCTVIGVHDSDYHTYRSMIAYLHTQDTPFFYLPSDLLVKVDQLDDPSTANVDNLLTKALQDVVSAAKASSLWYGVTPCSAHAMYRLADCYDLEELKEMGLGFITRSLTAENVSYELFSPLSLDYEAVQKPIFEFFVKNWAEIKKTKSFQKALEKVVSGELSKGKDLLAAIFQKTTLA